MDAEGLRADGDFGAAARDERAALNDAEGLAAGFRGIVDHGIVEFAQAQSAIRLVAAVGEGFGSDGEASFAKDIEHGRAGETHKDDVGVPASDACGDGGCKRTVAHSLIVERAVRLDVRDACAAGGGDCSEYAELLEYGIGDGFGGHVELEAAEVCAVGIARVGPEGKFPAKGMLDCGLHGLRVARMASAGDIDGS